MTVTLPYNRERAVAYARKWALSRNPLFSDFSDIGGNCTNFVSQAIYAGSCQMNFTKEFGWYYISIEDRAPAWTSVEYLYDFLTDDAEFAESNGGIGPFGAVVGRELIQLGDVIQLANSSGDFYHTLIITGFDRDEILVSAHTNDALDRTLSSYNYSSLRFIHIRGVRVEIQDDACFDDLYNGISLF